MPKDEEILGVLREIKALLEPKPAPPAPPPKKGLWNEFIDFISKYKVLGLAVAFIMGMYVGQVVQSLVKDILMPLIGLAVPGLENLSTFVLYVPPPTGFDAQGNPLLDGAPWKGQIFGIGSFISTIMTFIIVAFVIFLIVKITRKWGIE
ncbi:MAG: MscL family protein [Candidatus Bathyarchaeales archaeon]